MSKVLYIKNMVCPRCIETVQQVITDKGFNVKAIKLGEVEIDKVPSYKQMEELSHELKNRGFELLVNKKSRIVQQIKSEIVRFVHHNDNEILHINLSDHIAGLIGADYSFLSNLFSAEEGITIEKYTILQKVERVKELLSYGELTASEIAFKLGYSSAAHLSSQFKKETGMTTGQYKNLKDKKRQPLDQVGN